MIEIVIPGKPVPWARVGTGHTRPRQAKHRKAVAREIWAAARQAGVKPIDGPVGLSIQFFPDSMRIQIREIHPIEGDAKTTRPDIDNLVKQIMEALEESGLIDDDAQVAVVSAEKWK